MTERIKATLRINAALNAKITLLADRDGRSNNQFLERLIEHAIKQIELADMAGPDSKSLFPAYPIAPVDQGRALAS